MNKKKQFRKKMKNPPQGTIYYRLWIMPIPVGYQNRVQEYIDTYRMDIGPKILKDYFVYGVRSKVTVRGEPIESSHSYVRTHAEAIKLLEGTTIDSKEFKRIKKINDISEAWFDSHNLGTTVN